MRILVFSDIHGMTGYVRDALLAHPEADAIIFLGDGERDFDSLSSLTDGKITVKVCGNCDFASMLPVNEIAVFGGVRIFCTHGFAERVKYGDFELEEKARKLSARIALYGHTHNPVTDFRDGLYIMNPGAAMCGSYGIIDIVGGGIMCSIAEIKR